MKKIILILTLLSAQAKGQAVDSNKIDTPIFKLGRVVWRNTQAQVARPIGRYTCKNYKHFNKDFIYVLDDGHIEVVGDTMKAIQNVIDHFSPSK